jgi:rhodanese-related sulfurtransferase
MINQFVDLITNHWILSTLLSVVLLLLLINEMIDKRLGVPKISPESTVQWMNREGAVLLDIRGEALFSAGHILGAEHVPSSLLEKRMPALMKHKDKPVVIVCNLGQEAAKIGKTLSNQGFTKVMVLNGGIQAWKAQGLPVVKS